MIKKENYTIILVILGCICLNLLNWVPDVIYDDKIIYKYLGLVIYKGAVPYRDAFENKPPLIFFLNALTWFTSYHVTWLLDTLLVLLATLMLYNLCKKNRIAWPWFLPLLFNLIIRNNLISYGNGMTREYTAVFLLMFFCVIFYKKAYKYFLLGALIALTFWMQQDAIITLFPFFVFAIFCHETSQHPIFKRILYSTTGFMIISLPIIFYFVYNKSIYSLWNDAFVFNFNLPRRPATFFMEIKLIKRAIHESEMEMAFYTAMILGFAGLILTRNKRKLLTIAMLTILLSFSAEYLTGSMQMGPGYMHYLLPLAATIPILVYVVLTETEITFLKDKYANFIVMAILCSVLIFGTMRYAFVVQSMDSKLPLATDYLPEIVYLNNKRLSDYQLYVFDDTYFIYLYNKYGILSPSRWNYHFFGDSHFNWDKDPEQLHVILQDLHKHKTTFILDCSDSWNYENKKLFYPEWKKFIQDNYNLLITDSSNRKLWRIQ